MADEDEPTQKTIVWIGTCREDLRAFPDEVKDEVGHVLSEVQWGRDHHSIKPLSGFGNAAVREVRVNDRSGTYRVVFTVQFPKAIYGLHAFQKKSKTGSKTPKEEMDRVRQRLSVAEADYEARFG
jgi:phage-related protein